MKKNSGWRMTIVIGVVVLIVGMAIGYVAAQRGNFSKSMNSSDLSPSLPAPAGANPHAGH